MRSLLSILMSLYLLAPISAWAEPRDPLSYSLRQYALMLGIALLGGIVSWYAKVRRGEVRAWSILQLVGELATSAFAGLMAFWICEQLASPPLLTASLVGIAGHMGTRAIAALETFAQRRWGALDIQLESRPAGKGEGTGG